MRIRRRAFVFPERIAVPGASSPSRNEGEGGKGNERTELFWCAEGQRYDPFPASPRAAGRRNGLEAACFLRSSYAGQVDKSRACAMQPLFSARHPSSFPITPDPPCFPPA